jgi:hypothetical protein
MIINLFPTLISHERFELKEQPKFDNDWKAQWNTGLLVPGLKEFVDQQVNEYFQHCGFTGVELEEYSVWLNQLEPDGRHVVPHNHGIALVGWVYYLDVADNSGDIIFLNPQGNNSWDYFYHPTVPQRSPNHDFVYNFKPKTGDLLIFPGWLSHYVEPNTSGQTRVSIAGEYHTRKFAQALTDSFKSTAQDSIINRQITE